MASAYPEAEASSSSPGNRVTSGLIDLKILSPSAEIRDGLSFTSLPPSTTVGQLKERIRGTLPSRPGNDRQRLIYRGRVMADETQTMSYIFGEEAIKQQKEHTLHLVIPDTTTQPGNTPPPNNPHRQAQPTTNPFQGFPRPNQPPNTAPLANPFRTMTGQRPASVPPMQGIHPHNTQVPNVPTIPALQQHMVNMHAMQQQLHQAHQRAMGAHGHQNSSQGPPTDQVQANHPGQTDGQGQRVGEGQNTNQSQLNSHPGQGPNNTQSGSAPSGPAQFPGTHGGPNNFTRSGVGPRGESWTVTFNTTTTIPQAAHMPAQVPHTHGPMPAQMPFTTHFPLPFGQVPGQTPGQMPGQMPGQLPGQNLQFGPLPPIGLPHLPTMNAVQVPQAHVLDAQMTDLERFVQEQQRRVDDFTSNPTDPTASEESARIRNDLQDAMTQLQSLRAQASNIPNQPNHIANRDPGSLQFQGNNQRTTMQNSGETGTNQHIGRQNGAILHNSPNAHNHSVNADTSAPAPRVYLLSSPTGPEALLLSPSGTYTSSGASHQFLPLQQNDPYQQRLRGFLPNMLHLPMGTTHPQFRNAFHSQDNRNNSPSQGANSPRAGGGHLNNQQQPARARQNPNLDQNHQGGGGQVQQQPQQAPQVPLFPNQQPRNVVAPGQVAQDAAQEQLNLGAIAGHVWFLIRITGFLWLLFGGTNAGFVRPFMLGVVAFLAYAAQQQGPIRRFGERIREHVEGLLRPQEEAGQRRRGEGEGEAPANAGVQGQPAAPNSPTTTVHQAPRTQSETRRAWARAQLLGVERALALFLASLWPGVGERHVQARERERRQREEEEARQRREQEERERLRIEEDEARAKAEEESRRESPDTAETVGLRSPPPPGQEEGLRERRQAMTEDAQEAHIPNGSAETKHKGKEPVRGEELAEGIGSGVDPKGSYLPGEGHQS
ncbi:hypothetical protein EV356DRAFT_510913 [Viridothelium virens]|uniref:Ubiquitin-like domain-containing protein n=1 Tax=Viridothelium virens TaxID=1048519 RepID=A0A6A6GVQ7_VIRVR|nr:hypothetical protein EV356DRAFT_510913 [Viridothelium virens]